MAEYIVGIDLGTTNTVVAYASLKGNVDDEGGRGDGDERGRASANDHGSDGSEGADASAIRLFDIEQLIAPGEVAARPLLPSQRYHPSPGELPAADVQLPWPSTEPAIVGALARRLGAQVPGRLVSSAKSWLSHPAVDRLAAILPWGAADDVAKVSPVAASASYLAHVHAAWNARFPASPLDRQDVVLTVPASFDDAARALTVEAARLAGLPRLRLLEEPQAAFYDWTYRHRDRLGEALATTRLVLVCDVGGGTTDLSLIAVALDAGAPTLTRIGVGNHLMLGGDNMDLALARLAESRLGSRLTAGQLSQLVERCRAVKERFFADDAPERASVTLLGSGARLVGGARSVEMTRDEVVALVVDGFFPRVALGEGPQRARGALVEFGLPYASDPAVTRHLSGFLQQHAAAALPDAVLLNGGVFRAAPLARRLVDTLADWRGAPLQELHNDNPDVAVARGAVAYALAMRGAAPRIGGGSARSYFLLLDGGAGTTRRGVCLLPQGSEPGDEQALAEHRFALRVGRPVRFHLASTTSARAGLRAGDVVDLDDGTFEPLPPIATVVEALGAAGRKEIAVRLTSTLTEVGTLEVHCVSIDDAAQRWRLEFQLRGDAGDGEDGASTPAPGLAPPPQYAVAVEQIERVFGARSQALTARDVKQLRANLERTLGSRERWPTPLLRQLYDALWQRARGRRRSAEHERVWLNLAGWCLRPGFGDPLDDWRIGELWPAFEQGVQHGKDAQVTAEWWTFWRRVAGGLPEAAQQRLLDDFAQNIEVAESGHVKQPAGVVKASLDDMVRLAASLERIPVAHKIEIGGWLVKRLGEPSNRSRDEASPKPSTAKPAPADGRALWALGRIGARQPFHGSLHGVVPPEAVVPWLAAVLALDWKRVEGAGFAAAHLARLTGDRARDVDDALRERIAQRLEASHAAPAWIAMLREVVPMDEASVRYVFGEALPPGLKLIASTR